MTAVALGSFFTSILPFAVKRSSFWFAVLTVLQVQFVAHLLNKTTFSSFDYSTHRYRKYCLNLIASFFKKVPYLIVGPSKHLFWLDCISPSAYVTGKHESTNGESYAHLPLLRQT